MPAWREVATGNWPGIIALLGMIAFGSYANGILPGQSGNPLNGWGIPTIEAWALGGALYLAIAALVARSPARERILGFPGEATLPERNAPPADVNVAAGAP